MKLNRLSIIFLLLVIAGAIYLWQSNSGVSNREGILKAVPVKSAIYNNYPWKYGTEVLRIIYSYPREQISDNMLFYVEVEIPDEVINYIRLILNNYSMYPDFTKEGLTTPLVFIAKDAITNFEYIPVNIYVLEYTLEGIPKRFLVIANSSEIPRDYNLLIVEFNNPYFESFYDDGPVCINNVGDQFGDWKVVVSRKAYSSDRFCLQYSKSRISLYEFVIDAPTTGELDNRYFLAERSVYIPVENKPLLISWYSDASDPAAYGTRNDAILLGLLLRLKNGTEMLIDLRLPAGEDDIVMFVPDLYQDILSPGVLRCNITISDPSLRGKLIPISLSACGIDLGRDAEAITKIYFGMLYEDVWRWVGFSKVIRLYYFFVGYHN